MAEPKIILWDIETTHNLVATFRLFDKYSPIPSENIFQERYIVCAAWKELGKPKVYTTSVLDDPKRYKENPHDDLHVVKTLHTALSDADCIVGHNGDAYDIKFTETRMLAHSLSPLPPIPKIDTLKIAKDRFLFNSNRLDYLGQFLGVGRKKHTRAGLWLRVLKGDPSAIREMLVYNRMDVRLLERVFKKLRPYAANHLNRHLVSGGTGCPRCGSHRLQSRGKHVTTTQIYERFQCQACGGWYRNRLSERPTRTSKRVL